MNLFLTMMGPPGARAFASTLPDKGHPLACSIPRARTFFEPPRCVVNFDKPCGFYRGTSYQAGTTWEIRLEYTGFCGSLMLYIYIFLIRPTWAYLCSLIFSWTSPCFRRGFWKSLVFSSFLPGPLVMQLSRGLKPLALAMCVFFRTVPLWLQWAWFWRFGR